MSSYDDLSITYDSPVVAFDGGAVGMAVGTVEVAYGANPMDPIASMVWTDISPWVRSGETKTGKLHELDQVQAGEGKFTIDNRDNRFSPWSTSPYALHTMLPIRVRARWDTTYPVWFGYIENVPVKWADAVNCDIDVTAVDIFKLLALNDVTSTAYPAAVLADGPPLVYYRLGDQPRSTTLADTSGNGYTGQTYGAPVLGQEGASVVDPDTAAQFDGNWHATAGTTLNGVSGALTVECWVKIPIDIDTTDGTESDIVGQQGTSASPNPHWAVFIHHDPVFPTAFGKMSAFATDGSHTVNLGLTQALNDGQWHHIVFTRTDATHYFLYVDGVLEDSQTATGGITFDSKPIDIAFVPEPSGLGLPNIQRGFWLDELAIYTGGLSATQVANHYQLGARGFDDELSGSRVATMLDIAGVAPGDRAIEAGRSSIQGAASSLTTTAVLAYCQQVETTEDGLFFQAPDGQITFYGRDHKLTNPTSTTSQITVGGAPGSEPYRLDGSQLGEDDLDIWNEAAVTRAGGNTQTVLDATSKTRYGKRTWKPQSDLLCLTDAESYDRANWVLAHNKTPLIRVGALPIDPRSDPEVLWPKVLGLGLQDRVTFSRPMTDGTTLTEDQLIEGVQHTFTPTTWRTVWNLDAADTQAYWIWGTSTWGTGSKPTRWAY